MQTTHIHRKQYGAYGSSYSLGQEYAGVNQVPVMGVAPTQITLLQFAAQWHASCKVFECGLVSIVVRTIPTQLNVHYAHCCVTITRRNVKESHDARLPQFVT